MAINRQFGSFVGDWDKPEKPKSERPVPVIKEVALPTVKPEVVVVPKIENPQKRKVRLTIHLDNDIVEHFRKTGRDWHPRINAALRKALGI